MYLRRERVRQMISNIVRYKFDMMEAERGKVRWSGCSRIRVVGALDARARSWPAADDDGRAARPVTGKL